MPSSRASHRHIIGFALQFKQGLLVLTTLLVFISPVSAIAQETKSVARLWNEELLAAIRFDEARPTVHARNLFHISLLMWDVWAAYLPDAKQILHKEKWAGVASDEARHQTLSHAAYRLLQWRFRNSPNYPQTNTALRRQMRELGYDAENQSAVGNTAAALGNRIADTVINYGLEDHANELQNYRNRFYQPVNPGLNPKNPGNPHMRDADRWQPFDLPNFVGQSGLSKNGYPAFVGPEWGAVKPFALDVTQSKTVERDGNRYQLWMDPGSPPKLSGTLQEKQAFQNGYLQVAEWSGALDATDGKFIDISPASRGNNTLGTNDGNGREINPVSGQPYAPLLVRAGDYFRVLAEFWADGPSSETPPGHWFTILNVVSDQPTLVRRFGGQGPELNRLEWDIKSYLTLGGAMHDSAIAAWSIKGWYDSPRPISAIRYLCGNGQSSDPSASYYHPDGMPLKVGVTEMITALSSAKGERHAHLLEGNPSAIGKIALKGWRGPDFIKEPDSDTAGVDWILCENWWPYQRPNFVSPPFAGYISGHSTYSRAAAEVMTLLTGSEYFPGGIGIFNMRKDDYLVFEKGPSQTIQLQWATYQDAADECGLSRIYGGIHPPFDDIPGRLIGYKIGHLAFEKADGIFSSGLD